MRTSVSVLLFAPLVIGLCACKPGERAGAPAQTSPVAAIANQKQPYNNESAQLTERLKTLCQRAGGTVGLALIHVETGRAVNIEGSRQLPLYSVFKLPLAVAVLKDVEENRLRLDTKVRVTPAEVVPGWQGNTALWGKPVERSIKELLEFSMVQSDNTSSDKLLQLLGGPEAATRRLRSLGYENIDIRSSIREYLAKRKNVNTGSAEDIANLLTHLQSGRLLQPPQLDVLLGFMARGMTGDRRLRGDLPPGTQVADKTGSGEAGSATNDVGIITLPQGRGHLAMAVLISGSKLPVEAQEKLIAELARVAYDTHVSTPATAKQ